LPRKEFAKVLCFGYEDFYADFLYIRSIQAFGGPWRQFIREGKNVPEIFETITELDPRFQEVYEFGSMVIAEDAKQPERAIKLNAVGVLKDPKHYKPAYWNAYISWWTLKNALQAKYWVSRAMRAPDCPDYVQRIIQHVDKETGQYSAAMERWVASYLSAFKERNAPLESTSWEQIVDVTKCLVLENLHKALGKYYDEHEKCLPKNLDVLVAQGYIQDNIYFDLAKLGMIFDRIDPTNPNAQTPVPGISEKTQQFIHALQQNTTKVPDGAVESIANDITVKISTVPPYTPSANDKPIPYFLRQDLPPTQEQIESAIKDKKLIIAGGEAFEQLVKTLEFVRVCVQKYEEKNHRYPLTYIEALGLGAESAVDPFTGTWKYNPITGEVKSLAYPEL
jgi:hypothetical protein